jgi:hypothetical protein
MFMQPFVQYLFYGIFMGGREGRGKGKKFFQIGQLVKACPKVQNNGVYL